MKKQYGIVTPTIAGMLMTCLMSLPAKADCPSSSQSEFDTSLFGQVNGCYSQGATGDFARKTSQTQEQQARPIQAELIKGRVTLPPTSTLGLAPVFGWGQRELFPGGSSLSMPELPPTRLDSFVQQSGGTKELIYGDESSWGYPPYFGYTAQHRINAGITGRRSAGLTTGHGSLMPSAVGRDEFLGGEWSMSGP